MMPAGFITEVWFQARLVLKKTFLSARIIYTLGASTRYRQKLVPRYRKCNAVRVAVINIMK